MAVSTILVVEENPALLERIRVTLERAGFDVVTAANGRDALALAAGESGGGPRRFDLVLLELVLPDMDGLELAGRLRRLSGRPELPIIAMSAVPDRLDEARRVEPEIRACLLEPVEPARILEAVERHILRGVGEAAGACRSRRVLVVDDDPVQRKLLGLQLGHAGFEVQLAANGEEALTAAKEHPPDAVVSDIHMPRMDGYELCLAIRREPSLAQVPVMLLSSSSVEEVDRELAQRAGATVCLTRTPDMQEAVRALRQALEAAPSLAGGDAAREEGHAPPLGAPVAAPPGSTRAGQAEATVVTVPDRPRDQSPTAPERRPRPSGRLDRQFADASRLERENAILKAQLTILGGLSEALARAAQPEAVLRALLERCLEVGGFTRGAVYLFTPEGRLALQAHAGFGAEAVPGLDGFFGRAAWLDGVSRRGEPVTLPARRGSRQMEDAGAGALLGAAGMSWLVVVPLASDGRRLGVLVLGSDEEPAAEALGFVRALGGQLGQAVALGQSLLALGASERQFRTIAEGAVEGILQTAPDGTIIYANASAARMFDYTPGQVVGRSLSQLIPVLTGESGRWEAEGVCRDGRRLPLEGSTQAGTDRWGRPCATHIFRDLTERREYEAQLVNLVNHDGLTGLFNRRRFLDELERYSAQVRRHGLAGALLLFDLDGLRAVNGKLGQQVGDAVLTATARSLQWSFQETATLARLGDDEFAVLLPHVSVEEAEAAARRARDQLADRLQRVHEGATGMMSASVGIAPVTSGNQGAEEVVSHAEFALQRAKEAAADRLYTYRPGDRTEEAARVEVDWYARIRSALEEDRFRLLYMPICRVKDRRLWGCEALLRMVGEDGTEIRPGEFLPAAERSGLMADIDRWVVRRAIRSVRALQGRHERLVVEVNLSGHSFADAELLALIEEELQAAGIPPGSLCFEITETAAITNLIEAREFINHLRAKGCLFALDDFGAGFSSFQYVKHLPVDIIKIDGSFIRELPRSATDQHLVKAIVGVAKALGKKTVAEFVGEEETLLTLDALGVDFAQGYYVGRPAPAL